MLAFPEKFPYGRGGFSDERPVMITPKKYFIQRVLNCDKRFASDSHYLFFAQYVTEMKQIRDNITVAMRMTSGETMTAGLVSDAEHLRQLIKSDSAYQFLRNVRGSPPYFQRAIKELIAMVAQIGCPHYFLTLSAADMTWPELFRMIGQQNGRTFSDADIAALSYEEKATMIRNDPVLVSRHFDHRLKAFFRDILIQSSTLGKVKDYFYRCEFQQRGSAHAHTLIWLEDGPDMKTAEKADIEAFFGSKISGQLPPVGDDMYPLVDRLQHHSHSVACRKGKKKDTCRFKFPRPPSDRTMLAEPACAECSTEELRKWRAEILQRVQDVLKNHDEHTKSSLDDILHEAGVSSDDYHLALSTNTTGRSLILQRRPCDVNINNYNRTILSAWQANIDIQPVLDVYACIFYIISYITKDEREMGEVLRAAKKEYADKDIRTQMRKIGSVFLTHREVSAQEAVFRLLGLTMVKSTVKCVFIPADMPDSRVRILKSRSQLEMLDRKSDVYMTGLVQRYIARPQSLGDVCWLILASSSMSAMERGGRNRTTMMMM